MTSIDDLQHDFRNVSDNVLGNLDTEERIQMFAKAAAEDQDERIKWLTETAPRHEYTATDLEYMEGTQTLFVLSLLTRHQLQQNYQTIIQHKYARDKCVALMLLNETLTRLSRGGFGVDEFGDLDAPDHADANYAYGRKSAPATAYLATKYRELWGALSFELLLEEDDRTIKYFPNLAAGGLLGYPDDLSGEAFDDLEKDRIKSEAYMTELRLLSALVDFYIHFHGWRLFAEEHLDITLDELLHITAVPGARDSVSVTNGVSDVDEQLCQNILSLKEDYLEAYPVLVEEWADDDEVTPDLDARAQEYADGLAEDAELPVTE